MTNDDDSATVPGGSPAEMSGTSAKSVPGGSPAEMLGAPAGSAETSADATVVSVAAGEPTIEVSGDAAVDEAPVWRDRLWRTPVLAAVAAVLLVAGVVVTVLYQHEQGVRKDRDRALAASQAQLAQVRAQNKALEERLAVARSKVLDPTALKFVKVCVTQGAADEAGARQIEENVKQGTLPGGDPLPAGSKVTTWRAIFSFDDPAATDCIQAVPYLAQK